MDGFCCLAQILRILIMIFGYRSCVRINCLAEGFQHYSSQLEQIIGHRLRLYCWYLQHHPYLNLRARWAVALIRIMMTQKTSDIPILVKAKEMKRKYKEDNGRTSISNKHSGLPSCWRRLRVKVQGGIGDMTIILILK